MTAQHEAYEVAKEACKKQIEHFVSGDGLMISENEQLFINGEIVIHVTTEEQSRFLIDLVLNNNGQSEDAEPIFGVEAYIEYPYYYVDFETCIDPTCFNVKLEFQLHASKTYESALEDSGCDYIEKFEDIFGKIERMNDGEIN